MPVSHNLAAADAATAAGEIQFEEHAQQLVMPGQKLVPPTREKEILNQKRNPFQHYTTQQKQAGKQGGSREKPSVDDKERERNKRAPSPITTNRDQPAAIEEAQTRLVRRRNTGGKKNQTTMCT